MQVSLTQYVFWSFVDCTFIGTYTSEKEIADEFLPRIMDGCMDVVFKI
jgi:hypothetical protein